MSRIYKGQKAGGRGEEAELEWEKFPATGLAKTYNTDYQGTNSICLILVSEHSSFFIPVLMNYSC